MFCEKLIERFHIRCEMFGDRYEPKPGTGLRLVILLFVTKTDGELPDGLGDPLLGVVRSIAPHVDPGQSNMVRVMELRVRIALLLDRRHKFILSHEAASVMGTVGHETPPFNFACRS